MRYTEMGPLTFRVQASESRVTERERERERGREREGEVQGRKVGTGTDVVPRKTFLGGCERTSSRDLLSLLLSRKDRQLTLGQGYREREGRVYREREREGEDQLRYMTIQTLVVLSLDQSSRFRVT